MYGTLWGSLLCHVEHVYGRISRCVGCFVAHRWDCLRDQFIGTLWLREEDFPSNDWWTRAGLLAKPPPIFVSLAPFCFSLSFTAFLTSSPSPSFFSFPILWRNWDYMARPPAGHANIESFIVQLALLRESLKGLGRFPSGGWVGQHLSVIWLTAEYDVWMILCIIRGSKVNYLPGVWLKNPLCGKKPFSSRAQRKLLEKSLTPSWEIAVFGDWRISRSLNRNHQCWM